MDTPITDTPIRTIRPEWTLIVDKMILVNLHVGRWRAATRTEFQEFGLDAEMFRAYTAGARRLLPNRLHDELETLERMARDLQARYSYHTLFGYLMPKEKYEEFKVWIEDKPAAELRKMLHSKTRTPDTWANTSLKDRWFALAEEIAAARDALVDEMVENYRPSAIVRWRVANGLPKDCDANPPDSWLDDVLTDMVYRIPTAKAIRDSFQLDITPSFVEAPDEAVKATKLEEIARMRADVERQLEEIEQIDVRAMKDKAYIEVRAVADKASLEMSTEREKARLTLLADKERLEREQRITEEVLAHEKKLRQDRIEKTLNSVAGQLHTLVYGAVCDGLEQIQTKNKLHPRWVGRVKNLVEQVQLLNFTDDVELARVCGELEQMIDHNAASEANASHVRDALVGVGISLKAELVAGGIESRSARDLGIPDQPGEDLVRRARREVRDLDLFGLAGIEVPTRGMRSLDAGKPTSDLVSDPLSGEDTTSAFDLPIRQFEFLLAVESGQPVVKNGATRFALVEKGLIEPTKAWTGIIITPAGRAALDAAKALAV